MRPQLHPTTGDALTSLPAFRKKGTGTRAWLLLVLDLTGQTQVIGAGKYDIMRRTGLPARDLRILDPLLSYPSTILGREKAIVINLEHIKAIITAQEVMLLNSRDPCVTPFFQELQKRMIHQRHVQSVQSQDYKEGMKPKVLPFEFIALEACLESGCTGLEIEANTLEHETYPALDKLTSKISTLNLERVRHIKSRLASIIGRVQKVRDELEHLLDDDEDMAEMYLTEKLLQQQSQNESSSTISFEDGGEVDNGFLDCDLDNGCLVGLRGENHGNHPCSTQIPLSKALEVEELEMLLEAYFIQIDGTLNKLSTLREYVDDTEDYINIMLDDKQNHLLQMGVMLTTATLVASCFVVLVGIFGMNIKINMFNEDVETGMPKFLWTVGGGTAGTFFLYVVAIAWCKHKRLLE